MENESSYKEIRILAFIGHGINNAVTIMKEMGIDVHSVPSIVRIFDTECLARTVFGDSLPCASLQNVVQKTGLIPVQESFHNAGNDAAYTLKAFCCWLFMRIMGMTSRGLRF